MRAADPAAAAGLVVFTLYFLGDGGFGSAIAAVYGAGDGGAGADASNWSGGVGGGAEDSLSDSQIRLTMKGKDGSRCQSRFNRL